MNELLVKQENSVAISDSTKELIKHGVSENMLAVNERSCEIVLQDFDTILYADLDKR